MTTTLFYILILVPVCYIGYLNRSWLNTILTPQPNEKQHRGYLVNSRYEEVLNRLKRVNRFRLELTKDMNHFKVRQAEYIMKGLSQQLQELIR